MGRGVALPAFLASVLPAYVWAQPVEASPQLLNFERPAYTLFELEQPPLANGPRASAQFVSVYPSLTLEKVPFRVREIRPDNLPSGDATNFIVVSPSSGVTGSVTSGVVTTALVVALNPKVVPYMRPGFYRLLVVLENSERPDSPPIGGFEVTLRLNYPGSPRIAAVLHAASLQSGISPGQLVTIRGSHLSTPPLTAAADSLGLFPNVVGHTRVTFNGIPAPLLFVSNEQINCVVPYGVRGGTTAQVVVDHPHPSGVSDPTPAFTVSASDTSPGIFTADESGGGPGAILNTGTGSGYNSENNPAPPGSTITFYATGAGAWNVAFPDGGLVLSARTRMPPRPVGVEFITPAAPVSVTIGGQQARVVSATAQPQRVSGMLQVTAEVPEGIGTGVQPVVLKIGDSDNTRQNVTVWVR